MKIPLILIALTMTLPLFSEPPETAWPSPILLFLGQGERPAPEVDGIRLKIGGQDLILREGRPYFSE